MLNRLNMLVLVFVPAALGLSSVSSGALPPGPTPGFVREAEIKHGRVAMTAGLVLASLAAGGYDHPTAALAGCTVAQQTLFFSGVGVVEAATYLPRLGPRFSLKEGLQPGRLFWDTEDDEAYATAVATEDAVGRIAMLGVFAYLVADTAATFISPSA